ncbi:MAG: hypothetical protein H7Y22_18635 [Gemmatimonadaceae bacterium]|nr:hypothetical protein [Gloeobacterales cyanobacterium ES-bin-141]
MAIADRDTRAAIVAHVVDGTIDTVACAFEDTVGHGTLVEYSGLAFGGDGRTDEALVVASQRSDTGRALGFGPRTGDGGDGRTRQGSAAKGQKATEGEGARATPEQKQAMHCESP